MSTLDRIRALGLQRRAEAEETARRSSFSIGSTASRAVQQARGQSNVPSVPGLGYLQGLAVLRAQKNPWYQNVLEGVGSWMRSAGRALEYPFAGNARREELKKEGQWSQHMEEGMPSSFQVGRELPPFLVPPLYRGASLLPQMGEAAATSTFLNWLDFDKNPTYGDLTANALGAMAAPAGVRAVGRLVPGGRRGSAVRNLPEDERASAQARAPRVKRLEAEGIKLRPAERAGAQTLIDAEDRFQKGRPGVRKVFMDRRQENLEKLNSLAARSMGEPATNRITADLLNNAGNRLSREFEDILNNSSLTYDKQFHIDLNNILERPKIKEYIEAKGDSGAKEIVNEWIMRALNARTISGPVFQQFERDLQADALDQFTGTARNPSNWLLGTVYSDIRDALGDAFERQMGKEMRDRYRKAKREYSSYQILSGQRVKDVVDANGNVIPARVSMALDQDKQFRKNFARDLPSHDLSLIKDYHLLEKPPSSLPLATKATGLGKVAEWAYPGLFGGTIPGKVYLGWESTIPSPQRSATTGRVGSYLGGRFGGTEMESALYDSIIQSEPEPKPVQESFIMNLLNYMPGWGQSLR